MKPFDTWSDGTKVYRIPVVYIAGPFRGANAWDQEQNVRRAEELALQVWEAGCAAICPHTNTRHYQGALPDHVWLEGDLAIVKKCDAIIMTADWQRSEGARKEAEMASLWGIPVFYTTEELAKWLNQ